MKKRILLLTFVMVLTVFLPACGSGGSSTPPAETSGGEASAGSAAGDDKHLIVAVDPDYESFDPAIAYEAYAQMIMHACYDNLFEFHNNMETLELGAAESYEVSEDGLTYTFRLKEGMVFSSGSPVTAEDVKWSVERAIHIGGNAAFMAEHITAIEAPDESTVVFRLAQTDPSFPTKLSYNFFSIIDSKLATENGATNAADAATTDTAKTWFDGNSAGSGPYMIESYTPKVEVVLVRNPNYWSDAPYYDKITVSTISDSNTQVMMLQRGDVDIAINVDPEQAKQLESAEGITIMDAQSLTMSFLLMNRSEEVGGPIADPKVQQAIRLALDYPGIQMIAGPGMTTPVAPFPVGLMGSLPSADVSGYPKVDEAKALMAEAGYSDGFTTDFYVPTTVVAGVEFTTLAQKIQSDLAAIGITTNIIPEDVTISLNTYRDGLQPLGLWYWNPDYPDNNSQLAFLPGDKVGLRANWTADMNSELAALNQQAATETDDAKRAELFRQIQEIMREDSPFAMLLQHTSQFAVRSNVIIGEYIDRYKVDFRNVAE